MRKPTLLLALTVLVTAAASFAAAHLLTRGGEPASEPTLAAARPLPGGVALGDPTPKFVADSRELAVAGIDDTASAPMYKALIGLARRSLGFPYRAFSLDRSQKEELLLDLTQFDCFLFVEQLLALVNSRKVDTQAEGLERFTEHVRNLRYENGEVDYCRRQHYFTRWAEAAEQNGYVVNITPFLPGAISRRQPLTFMSSHAGSYEPMKLARNRQCISELEQDLVVNQAFIPVAALPAALPSLRTGDIFALVTKVPGLDVTHVGFLEASKGVVDAIHAAEGAGVIRSENLAEYAAKVPDVIGVSVYRPRPNPQPGGAARERAETVEGRDSAER